MSSEGCPNCGYPNPAGNRFCVSCGQPLPAPTATAPTEMTRRPGLGDPPGNDWQRPQAPVPPAPGQYQPQGGGQYQPQGGGGQYQPQGGQFQGPPAPGQYQPQPQGGQPQPGGQFGAPPVPPPPGQYQAPPAPGQYQPQGGQFGAPPAPGQYQAPQQQYQAPGQYQAPHQPYSPYYQPSGMPPRLSRMSPGLIVGIAALALVALVVVSLGGFLVVRSLSGNPQANHNPTTNPTPVTIPSAGPGAGGGGGGSTPAPTPVPTPGGGGGGGNSGGGGTVTTSAFSLDAGSFQVSKKTDNEVDLQGDAGDLTVIAGQPSSPTTTQAQLAAIQQQLQSQYGSLQTCVQTQSLTIGGKSGTIEGWLYTAQDSSGSSVQVCDAYWIDVSSAGTLYGYEQLGPQATWGSQLETAAQPVRQSIQWLV